MASVRYRPKAADDLGLAIAWYDAKGEKVGNLFVDAYEKAIERVSSNPYVYASDNSGLRIVRMVRFPYAIYFRVRSEQIVVLAIMHTSRDRRSFDDRLLEDDS